MRIFILTAFALMFFAANSVLNRAALAGELIGPASFVAIRLGSGAVALVFILWFQGILKKPPSLKPRLDAVFGLILYAIGFSFAYMVLDAGFGALVLFGTVQITMFLGAIIRGNKPVFVQWIGAAIGMAGLAYAVNPETAGIDPVGALIMVSAGIGWGLYSLAGQKVSNALVSTTVSFVCATPIAVIAWIIVGSEIVTAEGVMLAVTSGVVTSGFGYVVWYTALPHLQTSVAAIVQLAVPLIAMLGGILFLNEVWTLDFTISASLVLGGIALSLLGGKKQ